MSSLDPAGAWAEAGQAIPGYRVEGSVERRCTKMLRKGPFLRHGSGFTESSDRGLAFGGVAGFKTRVIELFGKRHPDALHDPEAAHISRNGEGDDLRQAQKRENPDSRSLVRVEAA